MRHHRSLARAAVGVTCCLLVATACSKSSKSAGTTTTRPTAATTTTTTAAPTSAAGAGTTTSTVSAETTTSGPGLDPAVLAKVKAINLVKSDLPPGWTATPSTATDDTAFTTCDPGLKIVSHTVAKADSDQFELTQDTGQLTLQTVTSQIDSIDVAKALTAKLADQAFVDCVSRALVTRIGLQATGQLMIDTQAPKVGDEVRALQGQFLLTSKTGQKVNLLVELVAVRTGSIVTTLSATAVSALPDHAVLTSVLDKIGARQHA